MHRKNYSGKITSEWLLQFTELLSTIRRIYKHAPFIIPLTNSSVFIKKQRASTDTCCGSCLFVKIGGIVRGVMDMY